MLQLAVTAFEWDEANLEHIRKHGFSPEDAEEVILDARRISSFPNSSASGERRFGVVGKSPGGAILHVVFVIRAGKVRPFHCREANAAEKRRYRR